MSYGTALALQQAIYQRLTANTALAALVGGAIYDATPPGVAGGTYVLLGPEDVRAQSDKTGGGAWHRLSVSVISNAAGFQTAKQVAAAISDALVDAPLTLSRGTCPALHFFRARARRDGTGDLRRIDLIFQARVDDTPFP